MLSDFVEGELLSKFLKRQRGGRLSPFQGIHLLHALASGIECIHSLGEYHGDLHTENIIVTRFGLGFERTVQFLTGVTNIRDVIPFPRTPKSAEF